MRKDLFHYGMKIYPCGILVTFDDEQRQQVRDKGVDYQPYENVTASVSEFWVKDLQPSQLYVVNFNRFTHNAAAHEAVHVATSTLNYIGHKFDLENDEVLAYLVDTVFNILCDAHKDWCEETGYDFIPAFMPFRENPTKAECHPKANVDCNAGAIQYNGNLPVPVPKTVQPSGEPAKVLGDCPRDVYQVIMPVGLHPDAQTLVAGIAQDMANKLMKAQEKYGWTNGWRDERFTPAMWTEETIRHIQKGDPLDVINYMAFARDRKWATDLLVDGFSAMFVKQDNDKLAVETLNKADILLDAKVHEAQFDEDTANRQYESLSLANAMNLPLDERNKYLNGEFTPEDPAQKYEPCCPYCKHPRISYTARSHTRRMYCKSCHAEFDEYALRER